MTENGTFGVVFEMLDVRGHRLQSQVRFDLRELSHPRFDETLAGRLNDAFQQIREISKTAVVKNVRVAEDE